MQHTLCVAPGQSSTEVITVKLFKLVEGLRWGGTALGTEKRGCCIFLTSCSLTLGCLAPWALPNHSGWTVLAHIAFFSHWVQQWRWGLGDCFLHNVANSQENTVHIFLSVLPVTKYLHGYLVQSTKCHGQHLIKSLQNCLLTVLNVRN